MRWIVAAQFGLIGCVLGLVAADRLDSRFTGVCVLSGGAWFAILGAVLGGAGDIARAIRESGHAPQAGGKSGRGSPEV
jgi:hypothetical protein